MTLGEVIVYLSTPFSHLLCYPEVWVSDRPILVPETPRPSLPLQRVNPLPPQRVELFPQQPHPQPPQPPTPQPTPQYEDVSDVDSTDDDDDAVSVVLSDNDLSLIHI